MACCEVCGKQVDLPFRCNYCGGLFCAEHRLPESHNCQKKPVKSPSYILSPKFSKERPRKIGICPRCHREDSNVIKYNAEKAIFKCRNCGLIYGQKKSLPYYYFRVRKHKRAITPHSEQPAPVAPPFVKPTPKERIAFKENRVRKLKKPVLGVLIIAIVFASFFFLYQNPNILNLQNLLPKTPSYNELVSYELSLINSDRQQNGLQNVTLSNIDSAQLHAEDMLKNNYFSHWDMNGYKPYMRYTLAGGQGAVAENCAAQLGSYSNLEQALKSMEYNMMYNDAASNWGHKGNILNPLHNEVSIGIAFDSNNVYLVQDFINDYISWNQLSVNGNQVIMQGTIQTQPSNIQQIAILYDNPSPLTVNQLNNPPYQDGYDPGTNAASVLPPNWQATNGITITVDNWNQNGNSFQISFSLSQAIAVYGNGVYTLYLEIGNSTADSLTTYSVWIN